MIKFLGLYNYAYVIFCILFGVSSVGRASACQAEGRQFESGTPLQIKILSPDYFLTGASS